MDKGTNINYCVGFDNVIRLDRKLRIERGSAQLNLSFTDFTRGRKYFVVLELPLCVFRAVFHLHKTT